MSRGNGYIGSESLQTSVANEEIVPLTPPDWTSKRYTLYKFSFINGSDCTIQINNEKPIFLKANQGISTDAGDKSIKSFRILESGISFNWVGTI